MLYCDVNLNQRSQRQGSSGTSIDCPPHPNIYIRYILYTLLHTTTRTKIE